MLLGPWGTAAAEPVALRSSTGEFACLVSSHSLLRSQCQGHCPGHVACSMQFPLSERTWEHILVPECGLWGSTSDVCQGDLLNFVTITSYCHWLVNFNGSGSYVHFGHPKDPTSPSTDRKAWWGTVHGVAESRTRHMQQYKRIPFSPYPLHLLL